METGLRRWALEVAARALQTCLNADTSDYAGRHVPCPCGREAVYAGRREKSFETALGELRLQRAYYHCSCGIGFFPRDQALGLAHSSLSPALQRMAALVGALVSFEEGSELLGELAGVRVNAKQVERVAESVGREMGRDEEHQVEVARQAPAATVYLGMDGTGVPLRASELEGRAGKQPDGSAKTREVKLCTVWTAETRDQEGRPTRDEGSVSYSAAIESVATRDTDRAPSPFARRVVREADRRGFQRAARQVILGDGAPWIWNLADEYFPHAIQIVDLFHVLTHLSEVGKAVYGPGTDLAKHWTRERQQELEAGHLDSVLDALRRHPDSETARNCIEYLQNNRSRLRYAAFRAAGLCTSTAVVEAGCKVTVCTRLKRAGMHWSVRGANAILALRCYYLSGRFEDFWERRASAD